MIPSFVFTAALIVATLSSVSAFGSSNHVLSRQRWLPSRPSRLILSAAVQEFPQTKSKGDSDNKVNLHGYGSFKRENPMSDKFSSRRIHHVEFYTGEATATYMRFMIALGMKFRGKSDYSTGNKLHASYLLQSNDVRMVFTSPYPVATEGECQDSRELMSSPCWPNFNNQFAESFIIKHGLAVRAIGIEVDNVREAYDIIVANGGTSVLPPTRIQSCSHKDSFADVAEIKLYGDVVIRLLNKDSCKDSFLPGFQDLFEPSDNDEAARNSGRFKLEKFDHIVGNVDKLSNIVPYVKQFSGFHEFAEFVAADVGTVDSGLNSVVLANNNEEILLPINEPTFGTKRKSQIQTYLEQNRGAGVQHIALYTSDIFQTMKHMKEIQEKMGCGFIFMDPPDDGYYDRVKERLQLHCDEAAYLTDDQLRLAEKYGLLLDRDDQGLLLQIFTKPIGDRPTIFIEIIQRMGCPDGKGSQKPGCGGFGKGNFRDLFKSIEDYENSLGINNVE